MYVRVTRGTVLRTTQEIALVELHMYAHKWPSVFGMLRGSQVQTSDLVFPSNDTRYYYVTSLVGHTNLRIASYNMVVVPCD